MQDSEEMIVLVDADDRIIGTGEKIETHRKGALHRAFSVIVWNSAGRLLLQKRAKRKYHSGGLWTNACCGHPRPEEEIGAAARRRLEIRSSGADGERAGPDIILHHARHFVPEDMGRLEAQSTLVELSRALQVRNRVNGKCNLDDLHSRPP